MAPETNSNTLSPDEPLIPRILDMIVPRIAMDELIAMLVEEINQHWKERDLPFPPPQVPEQPDPPVPAPQAAVPIARVFENNYSQITVPATTFIPNAYYPRPMDTSDVSPPHFASRSIFGNLQQSPLVPPTAPPTSFGNPSQHVATLPPGPSLLMPSPADPQSLDDPNDHDVHSLKNFLMAGYELQLLYSWGGL